MPAEASSAPAGSKKSEPAAAPSDTAKRGGGPQIVAISVEPVPLKDLSSIPGGSHAGQFAISPAGTVHGGKGGGASGGPDAGAAGRGAGSEKALAVGNGSGQPGGEGHGPGPAGSAPSAGLSISGPPGGGAITAGTLPPLKPEDLVYAVKPETPKAHAPSMVVSSGSLGGGGLRIYGVLHGDRIYTVYFSMPGKNWILQYCARQNSIQVDSASRTVQLQIQPPLTPPAALEQYDFHRPPPASDAPAAMIILHGLIHPDGTVSGLEALEGRDAVSNAAACAAFGRWKFKPALRAGNPVELEILMGIP